MAQLGPFEDDGEAERERGEPVHVRVVDRPPRRPAIGVEEADHSAVEHDGRGDVPRPAERLGEGPVLCAAGVVTFDDLRATPTQDLALDERVSERDRGARAGCLEHGAGVGGAVDVQRLGNELAVAHASQQHTVESERPCRLVRRAATHLACGSEVRKALQHRGEVDDALARRSLVGRGRGARHIAPHAGVARSPRPAASS